MPAEPTPDRSGAAPVDQQEAILATLLAAVLSIRDSLVGPPQPEPQMFDLERTCIYVSSSKAHLHRMRSAGEFPSAVHLPGCSHPRWRKSDLDKWLAQLRPARRRPRLAAVETAD